MGRYRKDIDEGIVRTQNLSAEHAARVLGVSPRTVLRRRREMGLGRHVATQQQRAPGSGWG